MVVDIWVRKCNSFAEERQADREFWALMTPDERVAAVEELRTQWPAAKDDDQPGLRRTIRVLERPER